MDLIVAIRQRSSAEPVKYTTQRLPTLTSCADVKAPLRSQISQVPVENDCLRETQMTEATTEHNDAEMTTDLNHSPSDMVRVMCVI